MAASSATLIATWDLPGAASASTAPPAAESVFLQEAYKNPPEADFETDFDTDTRTKVPLSDLQPGGKYRCK